jgi:hypothetical protein
VVVAISKDPYTYVELCYKGITGEGFAKRHPNDGANETLGSNIAFGRALHEIACAIYEEEKRAFYLKAASEPVFATLPIWLR